MNELFKIESEDLQGLTVFRPNEEEEEFYDFLTENQKYCILCSKLRELQYMRSINGYYICNKCLTN